MVCLVCKCHAAGAAPHHQWANGVQAMHYRVCWQLLQYMAVQAHCCCQANGVTNKDNCVTAQGHHQLYWRQACCHPAHQGPELRRRRASCAAAELEWPGCRRRMKEGASWATCQDDYHQEGEGGHIQQARLRGKSVVPNAIRQVHCSVALCHSLQPRHSREVCRHKYQATSAGMHCC